jgi:redox-regulated HSP33 family molecular chaperone
MRRTSGTIVGAAALLAAALFATVGHASSITTATNGLGAANTAVAKCDTDGVMVLQVLTGNNVSSVTISGIASGCGGATLSVTVNNGTSNSTGSAAVPGGGGSMTVALASAVLMKDSDQIDVSITGP